MHNIMKRGEIIMFDTKQALHHVVTSVRGIKEAADLAKNKGNSEVQRCGFYGYTPPGGRPEAINAAQRIAAILYPNAIPATSEIMISDNSTAALRNIVRALIDERDGVKDKVYVIAEGAGRVNGLKALIKDSGGDIGGQPAATVAEVMINKDIPSCVFINSVQMDSAGVQRVQQMLRDNPKLVVVDVRTYDFNQKPGTLSVLSTFPGSNDLSFANRVVTVDSDEQDRYPTIVTGPEGVMRRLSIRQMIASAGMSIVPQLLLEGRAEKLKEVDKVNPSRGAMEVERLAQRVQEIKTVPIREILNLATKVKADTKRNVPNASIGMPLQYSIAPTVEKAWYEYLEKVNNYDALVQQAKDSPKGLPELQAQLAAIASQRYNVCDKEYTADHTMVAHGANGALYAALRAIHEHDPERALVIMAPYFSSYKVIAMECGFKPEQIVEVKCGEQLVPDLNDLQSKIAQHEKIILLDNDPNNPSGIVRSTEYNQQMAKILQEHRDIIIGNDDAYHSLSHGKKPKSLYSILEQSENVRWFHGFSGSKEILGGPGTRVGTLVADFILDGRPFIDLAANIHQRDLGTVNPLIQQLYAIGIEQELNGKTAKWNKQRVNHYAKNVQTLKEEAAKTKDRVKIVGVGESTAGFYAIVELPNSLIGTKVPKSIGRSQYLKLKTASEIQDFQTQVGCERLETALDIIKWMVTKEAAAMVPLDSFGVNLKDKAGKPRLLYRAALGGGENVAKDLVQRLDQEVQLMQRVKDFEDIYEKEQGRLLSHPQSFAA